jgi:hypothetical protein
MSKKKVALIFFAGAICGIATLFGGAYIGFSLRNWLPYTRPDPAIVEHVEKIAAATPDIFTHKTLRLGEYRRWYVQGKEDNRDVIWGEWDQIGKPGLYLGHRRYPPNPVAMLDGGCGQVRLLYDIQRSRLEHFMCNPPP